MSDYKLSPMIWMIIFGVFLLRVGTSMSIPFIAIFLHFKIGINLTTTGLIVGAAYLPYIVGGFFGGVLSDKYGRRNLLCASLFFYALTFFAFGLSTCFSRLAWIVGAVFCGLNLLAGLCRIWIETLTQAMLADLATANQKITAFNLRYTAANVGSAIGPILGAYIGFSGTFLGFYFTGAMSFVYFILFMIASKQSHDQIQHESKETITFKESAAALWLDKSLLYFILGGVFAYLVYVQQESTLGQIMVERFGNTHLFAAILATNAITIVCLQIPLTTYCLNRISLASLMKAGCIFLAVGMGSVAFSGTHAVFYIISQVIFTLGEIFIFSIGGLFIDMIAPVKLRGAYFGSMGFQYLGKSIGPLMGGAILQMCGGVVMLCSFAVIAIAMMFFYSKIGSHRIQEGLRS